MVFGMWTIGFLNSVLTAPWETRGAGLNGVVEVWLEHIVWTSLLFWVPILGKFVLGHLWFLWNLALYSFLLIPFFHAAQKNPQGRLVSALQHVFQWLNGWGVLLVFPFVLTVVEWTLKPWMPGFLGSGYEWMWFLCFFAFGYACMTASEGYYRLLDRRFNAIVGMTVLFTLAFLWLRATTRRRCALRRRWLGGIRRGSPQHNDASRLLHSCVPCMVLVCARVCAGCSLPQSSKPSSRLSQSGRLSVLHRSHAAHLRFSLVLQIHRSARTAGRFDHMGSRRSRLLACV